MITMYNNYDEGCVAVIERCGVELDGAFCGKGSDIPVNEYVYLVREIRVSIVSSVKALRNFVANCLTRSL